MLTVGYIRRESPGVPQCRGAASLRRQQFPWKPTAVQRPRTWKMPMGKEANARSQPAEGRPSQQRRRQVAQRKPEEVPQGSTSQASSHHGITLPQLRYSERSRPMVTQQAQVGSPRETEPNVLLSPAAAEGKAGGGPVKLGVLWAVAVGCGGTALSPASSGSRRQLPAGLSPALQLAGGPSARAQPAGTWAGCGTKRCCLASASRDRSRHSVCHCW
ncbi:uncharacterized protein LOC133214014 [Neopsephotus bourkii]|uniref:uncharacterized protein LOC133214014 n=1 Tax=Neopsephotus bourkii TaxID=309878 RepID=UPI002AA519D6|nr:uncharacterized protein LOC133214014 [Neopsephotus bourkii]